MRSYPGLTSQEWQSWDWQPCVSNSKVDPVTPHGPFNPTLPKNGSVVGDEKKKKQDPALWALVRSAKDVDGSPLRVLFRLSPARAICHCWCWFKGLQVVSCE